MFNKFFISLSLLFFLLTKKSPLLALEQLSNEPFLTSPKSFLTPQSRQTQVTDYKSLSRRIISRYHSSQKKTPIKIIPFLKKDFAKVAKIFAIRPSTLRERQAGLSRTILDAANFLYYQGFPRRAVTGYHQAAFLGDSSAQFWLATHYERGNYFLSRDTRKAEIYYCAAIRNGNEQAFIRLGVLLLNQKKYKQALAVFNHATGQDINDAYYWTGYMYENGLGVSISPENAEGFYIMASHAGISEASQALDNLYLTQGQIAYSLSNLENAILWYRKAMSNGSGKGALYLGEIYESQNLITQALSYYNYAKNLGITAASIAIQRLKPTPNVQRPGLSPRLGFRRVRSEEGNLDLLDD